MHVNKSGETVAVSPVLEKMGSPKAKSWSRRRKLAMVAAAAIVVVALAVGLGAGFGIRHHGHDNNGDSSGSNSTTPNNSTTTPAGIWQPKVGATWNYQINQPLNDSTNQGNYDVWDIDLFDNDASMIAELQARGSKVICYFSAGSYEKWRADAKDFDQSDLGAGLAGWDGENWLKVSSQNVRNIMLKRLDVAVQKKCDGVDPDNVDGYNNKNGLGLTKDDAIDYVRFLADAAHQRNLSIGLKNAAEIIPDVIDRVQYSVNEQCVEYTECNSFAAFIKDGKPVFHVEYPKGEDTNNFLAVANDAKNAACDTTGEEGFSTIIKNMNLDSWIQVC